MHVEKSKPVSERKHRMNMNQLRFFEEPGIVASAILVGGNDYLTVGENGMLNIPEGVKPEGFYLMVSVEKDGRTFVVQKDVGTEGGAYSSNALSGFGFGKDFNAIIMRDPIEVIRAENNVWTGWHKKQASNRVDCWRLGEDGKLDLFQVGILTHDNGQTWHLYGEYRWRGKLFWDGEEFYGVPEHPKWGSLEGGTSKRTQIFDHSEFIRLLQSTHAEALTKWDNDVNPPLPEVPDGQFAVVDWFIACAGQTGQGIVKNKKGASAWVHGIDIEGFNPNSLEPPLWHGDIISYEKTVLNWGAKKDSPPKLTGVKLVKRGW